MRIAHWSIFAPTRSGLYHTTKDIVVASQAAGIDAGLIDATNGKSQTDGNFGSVDFRFADTADIYLMHLAVPEPYYSDGTPIVVVLHGNPLYSMQTELYGLEQGNPAPWTTICNYMKRTEPTWFVSMWEEEQRGYWDALAGMHKPPRIRYVPRGIVFGDQWTVDGPTRDLEGEPAIVIADQFRYFKDALPSLWGAYHYWQKHPKTRVHIYGLPDKGHHARDTLDRWLSLTGLHRMIGSVNGIVDYLPEVFRGADMLLSTVTGESRVVLEALACGCAVVAPWPGATMEAMRPHQPVELAADIGAVAGEHCGKRARKARAQKVRADFDIKPTVAGLKELYEEILEN